MAARPQPLTLITAILRISDKYDIPALRRDAIGLLHAGAPFAAGVPPRIWGLFPNVVFNRNNLKDIFDLTNTIHVHHIDTLRPVVYHLLLLQTVQRCNTSTVRIFQHGYTDTGNLPHAHLLPEVSTDVIAGYAAILAKASRELYS